MRVHDELALEVAVGELGRVKARLSELMAGAVELNVPLKVETGIDPNWEAAH